MFVEKLELFGFKSFAARTEVPFARGITAIVGPNGCGKSNISDALRWVLGEQNARTLRGDRIQDVIFKGTRQAKPLGLAEAVLTVSNDDGTLPLEYTHVAVARRIFRSGESEFSINKVPCRLKDIRDLFAGTGLGSHGYAVIERDMVDAVLSEKDDARRFLFEEAAGITKYKQRRKESERRLEGVEQDLTRIEDMIREIERGVRSLARQAGKVRRWRRLKAECDHHEVRAAWEQWRRLRERSASSETLHARREREKAEAQGALAILETRHETQRLNLLELATRLEEAQRASEAAVRGVSSAREEIRVLSTRAESWADEEKDLAARLLRARQRLEDLRAEQAALQPRLAELREEAEAAEAEAKAASARRGEADLALRSTRARLQSLQQLSLDLHATRSGQQRELEGKRERRQAVGRRLAALANHLEAFSGREGQVGADLAASDARLTALDAERRAGQVRREERTEELEAHSARLAEVQARAVEADRERAGSASRLDLLAEQKGRHEGFDAAVRALLEDRSSFPGLVGVVGEELRVRPEAETLGRAVLGEHVPWVLARDEACALEMIHHLRARGLGGVTFFPLREAGIEPPPAEEGARKSAAREGAARGSEGRGESTRVDRGICELFDAAPAARPFLGWLAAATRLAASLEEARALAAEGFRAITPEGDVVDPRRVYRLAGGEGAVAEILHRELEIPVLAARVAETSETLAGLRREEEGIKERVEARREELRQLEERRSALERERAGLAEQRTGLRTELAMLGEERIRLAQETEQLAAEARGLDEEIERLAGLAERSEADAGRSREDFDALSRQAEEEESHRDERARQAAERDLEVVRLRGALSTEEGRGAGLEREAAEVARAIEESSQRYEERSREAAEASRRAADLAAGLDGLERTMRDRERELAEARSRHQACQDGVFSLDAEIRSSRERFDAVVQALHAEDFERLQTRGTADRLRDRILEDHGVDLETYEPPPDPVPRAPRPRRARSASPEAAGAGEAPAATEEPRSDASAESDVAVAAAGGAFPEDAGVFEDEDDDLAEETDLAEGEIDLAEDGLESEDEAAEEPEFAAEGEAGAGLAYTPETRTERIAELRRAMAQMGNLNFLAEEEYSASRERLAFHQKQAADLRQAREDLLEAIRRINETAGRMFQETFASVQEHFLGTFDRLFPGGEASLTLQGGDPLEGDIEIAARPRGKRLESIRLLSSGERALTAIALLFAIYLAKPSPVCLLDEVDAPLDDANLDRFLSLVRHFSERTQFICITHNKKTMEMADRLFGVTMEEPGISKLVSVHLDGGSAELLDRLAGGPDPAAAGGAPGGTA